jgi:hypothetical protein
VDKPRGIYRSFLLASFFVFPAPGTPLQNQVRLPIEVTGMAGATESVSVWVPPKSGNQIRAIWMRIHNLAYPGMVSVRINQSRWVSLTNDTATVAEPGKSYGGIGGAVTTLTLTLALPAGTVMDGSNTIHFRFNGTNGVVSGFRILAFNFLDANDRMVLPADTFLEEDPSLWESAFRDPKNLSAGRSLWHERQLVASGLPNAPAIRAHCSDCHAQDGRDLKYFNFSNASIIARARFHGLSELEGRQIASYIRSLPFANPGRPWNPPYQPGPGLDAQPIANWAAGAGLKWVLDKDVDTLPFIFGTDESGTPAIRAAVFAPDGNLNAREIPIAFPLPDWNHWLPRVHPLDAAAFGTRFENSSFLQLYRTANFSELSATGNLTNFFDKWSKARSHFLTPHLAPGSRKWSAQMTEAFYAAELWQLVKTWEITQENDLEGRAPELYGAGADSRSWPNTIAAETAPSAVNIPNGPIGMGGSALTNEYFNSAWYELQIVLNSGGHMHRGKLPIDWVYFVGRFRELQQLSGRAEPGRLLIAVIKSMQSSDPEIGPENISEGWRPDQNIDPRIMIAKDWAPMFVPLCGETKRAITESLLMAWLDKTLRYRPASYFQLGRPAGSYAPPTDLRDVSGGRAWEAVPQFQAAGVQVQVLQRLQEWGRQYTDLARLYQY